MYVFAIFRATERRNMAVGNVKEWITEAEIIHNLRHDLSLHPAEKSSHVSHHLPCLLFKLILKALAFSCLSIRIASLTTRFYQMANVTVTAKEDNYHHTTRALIDNL